MNSISKKNLFLLFLSVTAAMTVASCKKNEEYPSLFETIYLLDSKQLNRIGDAGFLLEYNALMDHNIDSFFNQWHTWSDSLASGITCAPLDSLFRLSFSLYSSRHDSIPNITLPSKILVELYPMKHPDVNMYDFPGDYQKRVVKRFYYTPIIGAWCSSPVLYMIPKIESLLSEYLGSIWAYGPDGNKYLTHRREDHIQYLNSKIAVEYGHWGGYWHLTSMPTIDRIFIFTDGQIVEMTTNFASTEWIFFPNDRKKKPEVIGAFIM